MILECFSERMAVQILHQYLSITKSCHDVNLVGTGSTRGCRYNNFKYRRRRQSWDGKSRVSVFVDVRSNVAMLLRELVHDIHH